MIDRFDDRIYEYRWYIGIFLALVILAGSSFLVWQKIGNNNKNEAAQIQTLKNQNDQLRQDLSGQSKAVAGASVQPAQSAKININTANLADLDKIPSVGPVTAQLIIDYRNQHGSFKTTEELKNIKGIGDKTFEKMAGSVTIEN